MARVVRGGSYINNARNVRCAYRNYNNPNNLNRNIGFRVVAPHIIPKGRTRVSARQLEPPSGNAGRS
jgi:hypothetical protein